MVNSEKNEEAYNGFSDRPHLVKRRGRWMVWWSGGDLEICEAAELFAKRLNKKQACINNPILYT